MADRQEADEIRAAGAVPWRPAAGGIEVALVHRPKYDDWSFAKGKADRGEHLLLTAVREVAEETGLRVTLGRRLPPVRYRVKGQPKRVDYWVARAAEPGPPFAATQEIDQFRWVEEAAAPSWLSYDHDKRLLAQFAAGPRDTVPLILLRHGSAGHRSHWSSADADRPLDACGEQQAAMLAGLLRCFGAGRILSSPAQRCLATVRPFAAAVGVPTETDQDLAVSAAGETPAAAAAETPAAAAAAPWHAAAAGRAVARMMADARPALICAHRENMPYLLRAACDRLGAQVPDGQPLRKGEFWVLHHAAGRLAGTERHAPDNGHTLASFCGEPERAVRQR